MKKHMSKCFLLSLFLFFLISISSIYPARATSLSGAEQATLPEKDLTNLQLLGIDPTDYSIATKEYPQETYLDVLPQNTIRYTLKGNGSIIDMTYTFVNDKLQRIQLLENKDANINNNPPTVLKQPKLSSTITKITPITHSTKN